MEELGFKNEPMFGAKFSLGLALIRFVFDRKSSLAKILWSVVFIHQFSFIFHQPLLQVFKLVACPYLDYEGGF